MEGDEESWYCPCLSRSDGGTRGEGMMGCPKVRRRIRHGYNFLHENRGTFYLKGL